MHEADDHLRDEEPLSRVRITNDRIRAPSPIPVEIYNRLGLPWFELADDELEDLPASPVLELIKPIEF